MAGVLMGQQCCWHLVGNVDSGCTGGATWAYNQVQENKHLSGVFVLLLIL